MHSIQSCKKNQAGFTLIELMVVVAIIGILAATAIPIVGFYTEKARVASALETGACIQGALTSFATENQTYPDITTHDELAFISNTNGCSLEFESSAAPPSLTLIEYECLAVEIDPVTGVLFNTCTPDQGFHDFSARFQIQGVADKELVVTSRSACRIDAVQFNV